MEERLAAYRDVEGYIGVRLGATRVVPEVLARRHPQQVPLRAAVELPQVDAVLDDVEVADSGRLPPHVCQVDLDGDKHR